MARRQADLIRALGGGRLPDGFDARQVATAAQSLMLKRAGIIRKTWPALAALLGERLIELFSSYASMSPPPHPIDRDGLEFARWLCKRNLFPANAKLELAAHQVARGFPLRIVILRNDRRLALVCRIRAVRIFSLRWGFDARGRDSEEQHVA